MFLILFSLNCSPSKPNPKLNLISPVISFSLSALYPFNSYKSLVDITPPLVSIPALSTNISSDILAASGFDSIIKSKSIPLSDKIFFSTSYSDLPSVSNFLISTGSPKIIFLAFSGSTFNSNNLLKSFFCSSLYEDVTSETFSGLGSSIFTSDFSSIGFAVLTSKVVPKIETSLISSALAVS